MKFFELFILETFLSSNFNFIWIIYLLEADL